MKLVMWGWRAPGAGALLPPAPAPPTSPAFSLPAAAGRSARAAGMRPGGGPHSSNACPITLSSVRAKPSISLPTPLMASMPCQGADGAGGGGGSGA